MFDDREKFSQECIEEVRIQSEDKNFQNLTQMWMEESVKKKYSYHFSWMGLPIIQYPQDVMALQEIIFETQPDLVIETGIARGGSLLFLASMLELNRVYGGPDDALVVGVDIVIREHNKLAIEKHPLSRRVNMIEGSSIDTKVVDQIEELSKRKKSVMVCLDSHHEHDHVLEELRKYAPLVSQGNYCVVLDTIIEDLPEGPERPWGKQNSPMSAAREFLKENDMFEIDSQITNKLLITVARNGYLRRR